MLVRLPSAGAPVLSITLLEGLQHSVLEAGLQGDDESGNSVPRGTLGDMRALRLEEILKGLVLEQRR